MATVTAVDDEQLVAVTQPRQGRALRRGCSLECSTRILPARSRRSSSPAPVATRAGAGGVAMRRRWRSSPPHLRSDPVGCAMGQPSRALVPRFSGDASPEGGRQPRAMSPWLDTKPRAVQTGDHLGAECLADEIRGPARVACASIANASSSAPSPGRRSRTPRRCGRPDAPAAPARNGQRRTPRSVPAAGPRSSPRGRRAAAARWRRHRIEPGRGSRAQAPGMTTASAPEGSAMQKSCVVHIPPASNRGGALPPPGASGLRKSHPGSRRRRDGTSSIRPHLPGPRAPTRPGQRRRRRVAAVRGAGRVRSPPIRRSGHADALDGDGDRGRLDREPWSTVVDRTTTVSPTISPRTAGAGRPACLDFNHGCSSQEVWRD